MKIRIVMMKMVIRMKVCIFEVLKQPHRGELNVLKHPGILCLFFNYSDLHLLRVGLHKCIPLSIAL